MDRSSQCFTCGRTGGQFELVAGWQPLDVRSNPNDRLLPNPRCGQPLPWAAVSTLCSSIHRHSRRHGTRTGLRPSLAPVRLCLRIAANPNLDSPPACCGEILLERLPSNSARPFSPAAGFLFVKARGNSHQSVAVPVKSPVSHLHAIKQWHCDHRSSAKPPKGCKIDEVRRPFVHGSIFATPVLSLSALAAWTFSERKSRLERAFFRLSIQRRAFRACVRSETPRYILIFPLSAAPASAAPAHACLMLIPISASLLAMKAKLPGLSTRVSTSTFSSAASQPLSTSVFFATVNLSTIRWSVPSLPSTSAENA